MDMPPTALFTIRFNSGIQIPVFNVADAASALHDLRWPSRGSAAHNEAVRLADEALAGYCKAEVALAAVRKAADDAGILEKPNFAKK
jgi:hypothetical protein